MSSDPRAWTRASMERDRHRWPYAHALWRDDYRLVETVHGTLFSLMIEVEASNARVQCGEATEILVDGLPEAQWKEWVK